MSHQLAVREPSRSCDAYSMTLSLPLAAGHSLNLEHVLRENLCLFPKGNSDNSARLTPSLFTDFNIVDLVLSNLQ